MGTLSPMTEAAFVATDPALRVIDHDHPRRFAEIRLSGRAGPLAMSWRGDLIEPCVVPDDAGRVWVGVDQRVVCLSPAGQTLLSLGLFSVLLDVKLFGGLAVVLCETEVIVFDADGLLRTTTYVPDLPETVEAVGSELRVTLLGGGTVIIPV